MFRRKKSRVPGVYTALDFIEVSDIQGRRKHISIGPAPVRVMLALYKEALVMLVLCNMKRLQRGSGGHPPGKNWAFRLSKDVS